MYFFYNLLVTNCGKKNYSFCKYFNQGSNKDYVCEKGLLLLLVST